MIKMGTKTKKIVAVSLAAVIAIGGCGLLIRAIVKNVGRLVDSDNSLPDFPSLEGYTGDSWDTWKDEKYDITSDVPPVASPV